MKNLKKLGLQTAGLGLVVGTLITLGVYDNTIGYNDTREIRVSGRLESGEKYLIADTVPEGRNTMNTRRHIYLGGLGNVRTSLFANDWAQTYDVVGKDGKLVLINEDYILATNAVNWFSENAISNPNLRAHMIDLANKVLVKEKIKTTIREGSPNLIAALERGK